MTNTALALNARDYKGLSGSNQMMTAAMICLQSTRESDRKDMFAIDKGIRLEERDVANCIESREDRGLSNRKQEGTLICVKV